MNTDQLIAMLATSATPVEPNAAARRYAAATGWSALATVSLMAAMLGVRADLADAVMLPMFWTKVVFAAGLAGAGVVAAMRLSRLGVPLGSVPGVLIALVVAMWALAAFQLFNADPALRPSSSSVSLGSIDVGAVGDTGGLGGGALVSGAALVHPTSVVTSAVIVTMLSVRDVPNVFPHRGCTDSLKKSFVNVNNHDVDSYC